MKETFYDLCHFSLWSSFTFYAAVNSTIFCCIVCWVNGSHLTLWESEHNVFGSVISCVYRRSLMIPYLPPWAPSGSSLSASFTEKDFENIAKKVAVKRLTRKNVAEVDVNVLQWLHSKNTKYFQAPFLVLQLVTNRGLVSVPGWTNQYLDGPQ